jgi:hypothetical protein
MRNQFGKSSLFQSFRPHKLFSADRRRLEHAERQSALDSKSRKQFHTHNSRIQNWRYTLPGSGLRQRDVGEQFL